MKIVVAGLHAPMHQIKSLCMVTLRHRGLAHDGASGTVGHGADNNLAIVDIAAEDEMDFLQKAGQVREQVDASWHGPAKAANSTPDSKRIVYTGRLGTTGNWASRVSLVVFKEAFLGVDMVLGLHTSHSNPDTILVDISGPTAAI